MIAEMIVVDGDVKIVVVRIREIEHLILDFPGKIEVLAVIRSVRSKIINLLTPSMSSPFVIRMERNYLWNK